MTDRGRPGGQEFAPGPNYFAATSQIIAPICPDCGSVGRKLVHAERCPVGQGIDRVMARDRRWFDYRPQAVQRRRPITWAEAVELAIWCGLPCGTKFAGLVTVWRVAPGIRVRDFGALVVRPRGGTG